MTDGDAPGAGRAEIGRGTARLMEDLEENFPGAEIESYVVLVNFREGGRWRWWSRRGSEARAPALGRRAGVGLWGAWLRPRCPRFGIVGWSRAGLVAPVDGGLQLVYLAGPCSRS